MRFKAAALALGLVAGMLALSSLGGSVPKAAAANPLQVYMTSTTGSTGFLDRFALSEVVAGGASRHQVGKLVPTGPVAVNSDASLVLFGVQTTNAAGAVVPEIGVASVATDSETATPTAQTVVGIAASPTNPNRAYLLESNEIEQVNMAANPPVVTPLAVNSFNGCCGGTSIVISPDGATLYVGEDGDGFAIVQSFPIANPAAGSVWDGRTQNTGITLSGVNDVAMAPDGSALYVCGNGFNSAGASEAEVLALSLKPFSANENPIWAKGLEPGTPGGIQLGSPNSMTVSPDGQTVFAGGTNGPNTNSSVQAFAASNGTPGANGSVPIPTDPNGGEGLSSVAMTPDGQHVVVDGEIARKSSVVLDALNASNLQLVGRTEGFRTLLMPPAPQSLAITPLQQPLTTSFSVNLAQAGQATSFTAATPSGLPGMSFSYSWTFGDGSPAASGQSVSHVFATPGAYSVSVAVSGRSPSGTSVDTPGKTPFWRVLPGGSTQTINIPATPPPTTSTTRPHGRPPGNKPGPKTYHPKLFVNPTVGPPGTIVSVTGSGYPPNTVEIISWSTHTASIEVTTDGSGKIAPTPLPILIPDLFGLRLATAGGASAKFLVVQGTAEPGGSSNGLFLFRSETQ